MPSINPRITFGKKPTNPKTQPAQSRPKVRPSQKPKTAASKHASGNTRVGGIVYVHGIGNQRIASDLKRRWDTALMGCDLGERSKLIYWVNRRRYSMPLGDARSTESSHASIDSPNPISSTGVNQSQIQSGELSSEFLEKVLGHFHDYSTQAPHNQNRRESENTKHRLNRESITNRIAAEFLPDAYDYFFDSSFSVSVDQLFNERVGLQAQPIAIIAHGLGCIIAYNNLMKMSMSAQPNVVLFITLGAPFGLSQVQQKVVKNLGIQNLVVPSCVGRWVNVAEETDPVPGNQLLKDLIDDPRVVEYRSRSFSTDRPQNPHSAISYLKSKVVQEEIAKHIPADFSQPMSDFLVAKDVIRQIENNSSPFYLEHENSKQEILIEVAGQNDTDKLKIFDLLKQAGAADGQWEDLIRYIAVDLSARQIEVLASLLGESKIARIWSNSAKSTLANRSVAIVQSLPAARTYDADGAGVLWAVLDTGIASEHPHFKNNSTVAAHYDCTCRGVQQTKCCVDPNGHGTHVAGIIAGGARFDRKDENLQYSNARNCKLMDFKVLEDHGRGKDSYIIKALQFIYDLNASSNRLKIHGINLSLGGDFDPDVYGCGHSPLCKELRLLWNQGVVVVVSAGNSGYAELASTRGYLATNLDLSIGDPANLEEAIAVGSVHNRSPSVFGISYFSSKGPTADGRLKPDLVAPGEKISSANTQFDLDNANSWYVKRSGTSMAAPQVSGVIAAFLSQKKELIGRPQQVKDCLLSCCTDLGRDKYMQGAGIPNLVKMLLNQP